MADPIIGPVTDSPATREEILAKLRQRSLEAAATRRRFLKSAVGAGAAAAGLMSASSAFAQDATPEATPEGTPVGTPGATPGATPMAGTGRAPKGDYTLDAEQIYYNFQISSEPSSFDFNGNLYVNAEPECWAGLATFDADGNAVPDWAESWETNEDGSVWTFHIRPNNTGWSNGDPVTAHDFVWSFTRILSPTPLGIAGQNVYNFILFDVKNAESFSTGGGATEADLGLRAIDDWTFEVTLEGPRANFIQKVGYTACVPAHRPSVEAYGERWALAEEVPLVSNGPFKLDAWNKGVNCVMSRNDNYWNAPNITLETAIDPIIPGANLVTNYLSGSGDQRLDYTPISGADLPQFQSDPELASQISAFAFPGVWMLLPSNGVAPFDNLQVRKALSHAIDRDRLVTVTNGLIQPAFGMIPPGVFGYFEDPEINGIQAFDPQAAMDALVGTPYEGGQNWPEITVLMRGEEEQYNSNLMITDIIDQLQQNLGMSVQIQQLAFTSFAPELYKNTAQLVWIRWWYDYPDADNGYYDMFYGARPSNKRQAWANDEFDRIAIEAKAELDQTARLELYKQCERIIQEDVGYIPVCYRVDFNAFKPWVKGISTNSLGQQVPNGNIYVRSMSGLQISGRTNE
ncbi:MAG TPA: ABC transporter substrate-binding protein [Thermomicrobiales bacterium]|jgi:ABC-type oligopeptide transport system substrate-binding subunit|nr:ABC transporter substrate-binding protein [Thermomicrobiales bacterium]